jgi:hypothetical protein
VPNADSQYQIFCAHFRHPVTDIVCTLQTSSTRYSVHTSDIQYQILCAHFRQPVPDIVCTLQTASTRYCVHTSHGQYQILCAHFRQPVPDILCTLHTASTRYSAHSSDSQYQIFCAHFTRPVPDILRTLQTASTRYSVHTSHSQYQIFCAHFRQPVPDILMRLSPNLNFGRHSKNPQISYFKKNQSSMSPVVPCGQPHMTKLTDAFRHVANAPKNGPTCKYTQLCLEESVFRTKVVQKVIHGMSSTLPPLSFTTELNKSGKTPQNI